MVRVMRALYLLLLTCVFVVPSVAQSDLDKMVGTERAFAKMAADSGTKSAFLKYMAPDAVVFDPDKASANAVWSAKEESKDLLSWAPNYADISSNGLLGYTTGNWEYRANDKAEPTGFGEFFTIWLRR